MNVLNHNVLNHNDQLLNGWKEIGAYLNRGVRTVQRWERELQLPVRRPRSKVRSAVVAFRAELDQWMAQAPFQFENVTLTQKNAVPFPVKVLVVEDSVRDLNTCVSVLQSIGVSQLDAISNVPMALLRLEEMASGKVPKPNVIILDLAFPMESGFEVLRYWKSKPALRNISVVVWTGMGDTEQQLSAAFGVHRVVPKWAGAAELAQAVRAVAVAA
jgi:CheY-like chemotaxis protein